MPRKKKVQDTLLASVLVEDSQSQFVLEVHRTATFSKFYIGYVVDIATSSKRPLLPRNRNNAWDLDELAGQIKTHIETVLKSKVVKTEVKIHHKRLYARLLKLPPDKLGLTKLPKKSDSAYLPTSKFHAGRLCLAPLKMEITSCPIQQAGNHEKDDAWFSLAG